LANVAAQQCGGRCSSLKLTIIHSLVVRALAIKLSGHPLFRNGTFDELDAVHIT